METWVFWHCIFDLFHWSFSAPYRLAPLVRTSWPLIHVSLTPSAFIFNVVLDFLAHVQEIGGIRTEKGKQNWQHSETLWLVRRKESKWICKNKFKFRINGVSICHQQPKIKTNKMFPLIKISNLPINKFNKIHLRTLWRHLENVLKEIKEDPPK